MLFQHFKPFFLDTLYGDFFLGGQHQMLKIDCNFMPYGGRRTAETLTQQQARCLCPWIALALRLISGLFVFWV